MPSPPSSRSEPASPFQHVRAATAFEAIVAALAVKEVRRGVANEHVVQRSAGDVLDVNAVVVGELVLGVAVVLHAVKAYAHGLRPAGIADAVLSGAAADVVGVDAAQERVVTGTAVEVVAPGATVQDVVAVAALEEVAPSVADQDVGRRPADDVLDVGLHQVPCDGGARRRVLRRVAVVPLSVEVTFTGADRSP
jgi:hypothetical protein